MHKRIAALLLIVGALLVVLGVVFRGTPVHAAGATGYLTCGSVASPDFSQATHDGLVAGFETSLRMGFDKANEAACEDALSTRSTWTWVMIGGGAVLMLGALFTFTYSPAGRRPATA